jgi:hypothetical protein
MHWVIRTERGSMLSESATSAFTIGPETDWSISVIPTAPPIAGLF